MAVPREKVQAVRKRLDPLAPTMAWTPPADGRCVWDKLPAELKDIVFEMAYVPSKPIQPLSKFMWDWQEGQLRQKNGEDYWPGRFFTIAEQRFMVSREWCSAALKVFYKHATFYLKDDEVLYHILVDMDKDGWPHPYAESITSIVVPIGVEPEDGWVIPNPDPDVTPACLVRVVNACPALMRLEVRYTKDVFQSDFGWLEPEDFNDAGEADWTKLHLFTELSSLHGISDLSLVPIEEGPGKCQPSCYDTFVCRECVKRPYREVTDEPTLNDFKRMEDLLRPVVA